MGSEKDKMLRGEMYFANDPELAADRRNARLLVKQLNDSSDDQEEFRRGILKKLIGSQGEGLWIEPPFQCDYGSNIHVGEKVFFNFNCVILDVMAVHIGSNVMCGPFVQIYTATHPLDPVERSSGYEYAKPVTIGDDVWIGGGAIICPGVTIGNRSVIGAGSVVTRDIPDDVFAAGNPCKVVKQINQ